MIRCPGGSLVGRFSKENGTPGSDGGKAVFAAAERSLIPSSVHNENVVLYERVVTPFDLDHIAYLRRTVQGSSL